MGDTGSNLLGYMLAVIAIQGSLKTNAVVALFFPLIILAVPILDTGFVVAKRIKYRQPIYEADRWHFHHRMANIGFSQRRTLAYLYGWTAMMAVLALALRFVPYSDDRGNFDPFWTIVIVLCFVAVLAASFYLVVTLEILKLTALRSPATNLPPDAVDEGVKRELETGSFEIVNPATGEFERSTRDGRVRGDRPGRAPRPQLRSRSCFSARRRGRVLDRIRIYSPSPRRSCNSRFRSGRSHPWTPLSPRSSYAPLARPRFRHLR